ncbi:MAG: PaREP1/PaREP8 domain-contain protein [Chloroflexi bacterium]|nr:PaREP1/PaREP8 domain-contain protein [Chloroflexota bacterium]
MTTQKYRESSRHLMTQARAELAAGDVRQASEKGWGAAALMLKAVAEERGWEHGRHRHHLRTAGRLRAELGDRTIMDDFGRANLLHENFYEDEFTFDYIAESLDRVEALLNKLEPLLPQ